MIICWAITALSKLTIRLPDQQERINELVSLFQDHMNIEIQQRACEFLKLSESKWDGERNALYEPIPFKGDEGMTVDMGNRAVLDDEEGEGQLVIDKKTAGGAE